MIRMSFRRAIRAVTPGLAPGLLLVATLILDGCRGDFDPGDPGLVMELGISPTPPTMGTTRLIVTLRDTLGIPVEGARVVVEGTMTHAGMMPVLDTASAEGPGRYVIPGFRFTMSGDWILTLRATLPDGRWTELQRRTGVVGTPSGMSPDTGTTHPEAGHGGDRP